MESRSRQVSQWWVFHLGIDLDAGLTEVVSESSKSLNSRRRGQQPFILQVRSVKYPRIAW